MLRDRLNKRSKDNKRSAARQKVRVVEHDTIEFEELDQEEGSWSAEMIPYLSEGEHQAGSDLASSDNDLDIDVGGGGLEFDDKPAAQVEEQQRSQRGDPNADRRTPACRGATTSWST